MQIKYNYVGGGLYVYLSGELDECNAVRTREIIDNLIESNSPVKKAVFNMSGLTFMDSTGIGVLIGRYTKLRSRGACVYVESPSLPAEKILQVSGLYKIMPKV